MVALQGVEDEALDEDLETARECITLSMDSHKGAPSDSTRFQENAFDDLLLPTPTTLGLRINSPIDLFLSPSDVNIYSGIHSFLLSVRRAHLRLSQIFLLSVLRRDHPSPKAPMRADPKEQARSLEQMRQRSTRRTLTLRPVWATIGSATFFLAELGEYFQGEVIKSSWGNFHAWLDPRPQEGGSRPGTSSSTGSGPATLGASTHSQRSAQPRPEALHDPESLAQAHRAYLASLTHFLLLHDTNFTSIMRTFMTSVDHISALMTRLDTTHQNLDLETDMGVVDHFGNYTAEEEDLMRQLTRVRKGLAEGIAKLLEALKEVDGKRFDGGIERWKVNDGDEDVFVPERGAGVDRLLLKLDWGRNEV